MGALVTGRLAASELDAGSLVRSETGAAETGAVLLAMGELSGLIDAALEPGASVAIGGEVSAAELVG